MEYISGGRNRMAELITCHINSIHEHTELPRLLAGDDMIESKKFLPIAPSGRPRPQSNEIMTHSKQTGRPEHVVMDTGHTQGNLISKDFLGESGLAMKTSVQTSVRDSRCPTWTGTMYEANSGAQIIEYMPRKYWQRRRIVQEVAPCHNVGEGSKPVETLLQVFEGPDPGTNPEPGGHRNLWMDALCINQAENSERSAQVSSMEDIYRSAANRLSFPGDERDRRRPYFGFSDGRTDLCSARQSRRDDKTNPGDEDIPPWALDPVSMKDSFTRFNGTSSWVYHRDASEQLWEFGFDDYRDVRLHDPTMHGCVYMGSVWTSPNYCISFLGVIIWEINRLAENSLDKAQSILSQFPMMLGATLLWIGWLSFNGGFALASTLKAILHCLGDPVDASWKCLERRASRSRINAGQAMLMSMLLLPSLAAATPAGTVIEPSGGTKHCSSLLIILPDLIRNLMKLWATPQTLPRTFQPQTLLLATLLSTTFTVLFYTLIRSNRFTKYFLSIGLVASALGGAIFAVDAPDFMFRYLFVGINVSLLVSVFEHRFQRKGRSERAGLERDVEGNGVFEKEKDQMCG